MPSIDPKRSNNEDSGVATNNERKRVIICNKTNTVQVRSSFLTDSCLVLVTITLTRVKVRMKNQVVGRDRHAKLRSCTNSSKGNDSKRVMSLG